MSFFLELDVAGLTEEQAQGVEADWDAPAWSMNPELLPPLAEAMRVLGELLPQGFALRATWVGSEVRRERALSADALAEAAAQLS